MNIREWVTSCLWDENYFAPEKFLSKEELYRSGVAFPLVTSLIDGCGVVATWSNDAGMSKTATLFHRLRGLITRYGASWFYITDPDNALSVFEWEELIEPSSFNAWKLSEFETNPAQEGGASHLGIAFHNKEGMIIFELDTVFIITCYGTEEFVKTIGEVILA